MYTTQAQIEQQLQRSLNQYEIDSLTTLIPAIKTWIDGDLNTTFDSASPESRYYDIEGNYISIEPSTSISAVSVVDWYRNVVVTYTSPEQYEALPLNKTVKTQIRLRYCPIVSDGALKVTATFSQYDGGVPADVQLAATRIAAGLIGRSASGAETSGVVKESIEGYSVDYGSDGTISYIAMSDPIVKGILEGYREPLV
jgi:hypothetical protein